MHNFPPSSLLPIDPLEGEFSIRTAEILRVIEEQGEEIAVICFGAVQYYSGQWFDMEAITKAGQAKVSSPSPACSTRPAQTLSAPVHPWFRAASLDSIVLTL